MNVDVVINNTYEYITQKGFKYTKDTIYNLFLSLKSQQFVVLAGQSGCGKSSLARLFAESVGANEENGRFKTVCVESHWQNSEHLLGFLNPNGSFSEGLITEFLHSAMSNTSKPYFLCLEDFNSSRPQEYMMPIIYALSHKKHIEDAIVTLPIYSKNVFGQDKESYDMYGHTKICDNLYIIATSSTDESSYPITEKILEYSFPIEIDNPDITFDFFYPEDKPEPVSFIDIDNDLLKCEFITSADFTRGYENSRELSFVLQRMNKSILNTIAPISMHTRDSILIYAYYNRQFDVFTQEKSIDYAIVSKILSHIHGGTTKIKKCLAELFLFCLRKGGENVEEYPDSYAKMIEAKATYGCRYDLSADKIIRMMRRYEDEGYISFWK